MIPAYVKAFNLAKDEKQQTETYVDMTYYLPDRHLRSAFVRAFNMASQQDRLKIFNLVARVVGCDESEIASLAVDLCPEDWRAYFAMAKFRQIRVRWCELEGNFFTGKHLPTHAIEVLNIFMKAYRLAKNESEEAKETVLSYIKTLSTDSSYKVFTTELNNRIRQDN